jgi:hypothetical protein
MSSVHVMFALIMSRNGVGIVSIVIVGGSLSHSIPPTVSLHIIGGGGIVVFTVIS